MKNSTVGFTLKAAAFLCCAAAPFTAALSADAYPSKPIRLVVPSAAGGSPDVLMRALTAEVGKTLGQSFVIDNKPGASGIIGISEIERAAPDGYTLRMATRWGMPTTSRWRSTRAPSGSSATARTISCRWCCCSRCPT
ncbi:Bug family tripartite tricarboxylate transporter substrate binding protein [Cupriavidus basilensis]|uniref:Bug family tripartite tricarboxylate transporter substrate binding protein n=1 Tax=Cupriavidus basilensis TaxID=68895 RepID=UPI0003042DFF|nr:tripartite tricarboxylate transporter substrate-binding protein [Cupriavidus basilensis]